MFRTKELKEEIDSAVEKTQKKLVNSKYSVAIIDGANFQTFAKYMKMPFDSIMRNAMERTMLELCSRIDGAIIGFTQSDEICIIFKAKEDGQYWYHGDIFAITSYLAGMSALLFNKYFEEEFYNFKDQDDKKYTYVEKDLNVYREKFGQAYFHVNIVQFSKKDLNKLLIYKQNVAFRNSVQQLSQVYFNHEDTVGKNLATVLSMLKRKGVDYYKIPERWRMGCICAKTRVWREEYKSFSKRKWRFVKSIDFKEHPEYIDELINDIFK